MEIGERLSRQRIQHIVSSYQLAGDETAEFSRYLEQLLQVYPFPVIELALVETLIENWLSVPLLRGVNFVAHAHKKLKGWERLTVISTITPEQFQQVAGLDPAPIFNSTEPPARPTVYPS